MTVVRTVCRPAGGFRSARVAQAMWALDEQSRKLVADTGGLTPAELGWQPAPGMNSIGMLLAHIAVAEVHIGSVALAGLPTSDVRAVIGIGMEEEGLPLAEGAAPSPALAGRPIAWFHDLLGRARAHTRHGRGPTAEPGSSTAAGRSTTCSSTRPATTTRSTSCATCAGSCPAADRRPGCHDRPGPGPKHRRRRAGPAASRGAPVGLNTGRARKECTPARAREARPDYVPSLQVAMYLRCSAVGTSISMSMLASLRRDTSRSMSSGTR